MMRKTGGTYGLRRPILHQCTMALVVLFLATTLPLDAADVSEYRLKAEFIERLTRFIEWPDKSPLMSDPNAPFVIGVIGQDPFGSHLDDLARRHRIKGRRIEARRLRSSDDLSGCSIVFISRSERGTLKNILSRTRGKPILTIGDTGGFAQDGVIINFFNDDNRIQFEINEDAADASGLDIRGKLYKLARIVNESGKTSSAGDEQPDAVPIRTPKLSERAAAHISPGEDKSTARHWSRSSESGDGGDA